jgi:uncharacterized protein (DUF1778 family)
MSSRNARSEKLDLRISPSAKRTLRAASEARHETLSDFVLRSALRAAEDVLLERRRFELTAEEWAAFHAALDAPAKSSPALERLLKEPSVFD